MTIRKKIATLIVIYANQGLSAAVNAVLKKLFPSGNCFLSWESRLLFRCNPQVLPPPDRYSASILSEPAIERLVERYGKNRKAVMAAVMRGEKCWAIRDGADVVAYVWIREERGRLESDTAFQMELPDRLSYWWRDVYVHPAYRGRGLVPALFRSWACGRNATAQAPIYTEIAPWDKRSIKAHSRLGFERIGNLCTLCLLGVRVFYFRSGAKAGISFRFFPYNIYYHHPGSRKLFYRELQG